MEKYHVNIEFRYEDKKFDRDDTDYVSKEITIGVFDTIEEANEKGNKMLELLESRFELHVFPGGRKAPKERFSKNGGCFGTAKSLITDMAYLKTPFKFFARVQKLKYDNLDESITEAVDAMKRYRDYKNREE